MQEKITDTLRKKLRDALKANLEPIDRWIPELQFQSHIGSSPYFEEGEEWPTNSHGTPLDFIIQIARKDAPLIPEWIDLLQFYILWGDDSPYESGDECWVIKAYPHIETRKAKIIEKPKKLRKKKGWPNPWPKPCKPSFEPIQSLPSASDEEASYFTDIIEKMSGKYVGLDDYEKLESAVIGKDFLDYITQVGGYPQWMQYDEIPLEFVR